MGEETRTVPVVVTMRITRGCGHAEVEDFEFDMPADKAEPREEWIPGTCPECRTPIRIHMRRMRALQ